MVSAYGVSPENEGSRLTLLSITVEIEDGCSGHIQMKEGDSAEGVAIAFCRDYSLPDDFVAPLTEHILHNIINIRCVRRLLVSTDVKPGSLWQSYRTPIRLWPKNYAPSFN